MELFQVGTDPWGQEILIRISWGLLTVSFWAGIAFIIFHSIYAVVWKPRVETGTHSDGASGANASIPDRIVRHLSLIHI